MPPPIRGACCQEFSQFGIGELSWRAPLPSGSRGRCISRRTFPAGGSPHSLIPKVAQCQIKEHPRQTRGAFRGWVARYWVTSESRPDGLWILPAAAGRQASHPISGLSTSSIARPAERHEDGFECYLKVLTSNLHARRIIVNPLAVLVC